MSTHEGKKIVAAIDEFNANNFLSFGPTSMMSMALKSGRISDGHIKKFKEQFKEQAEKLPQSFLPYDDATVITAKDLEDVKDLYQTANRKKRKALKKASGIILNVGYMEVNRDVDGSILYDQYTPSLISYAVSPIDFNAYQNSFPVSFNSRVTSMRFIQSTSDPLNYKSQEFLDSLRWATVMMQALGRNFHLENPRPIPMFIPHSKGLFLGYAEGVPEDTFKNTHLRKIAIQGRVRDFVMKASPEIQPYVPTARTIVKVFFSEPELEHPQKLIWDRMMKLQKDSQFVDAMDMAVGAHLGSIVPVEAENLKKMDKLFEKIRELMSSREWRNAARNSFEGGHIPQESLYTKLAKAQDTGLQKPPKAQLLG